MPDASTSPLWVSTSYFTRSQCKASISEAGTFSNGLASLTTNSFCRRCSSTVWVSCARTTSSGFNSSIRTTERVPLSTGLENGMVAVSSLLRTCNSMPSTSLVLGGALLDWQTPGGILADTTTRDEAKSRKRRSGEWSTTVFVGAR